MKSLLTFAFIAVVASTLVIAQEKTETRLKPPIANPWFDMDQCEVCKCLSQHEDAMANLKWEVHKIPNGSLSVAVVPEEFKATMKTVKEETNGVIAKIEKGEQVRCCGYCQGMTSLIKSGAKQKELTTVAGDITLVTSEDPNIIQQIHAHAERTIEETKKMMDQSPDKIKINGPNETK